MSEIISLYSYRLKNQMQVLELVNYQIIKDS